MVLLDSSSLIAMLYDEPGAAYVQEQLDEASLLAVNLEETLMVLLRDGMPRDVARRTFDELDIDVISYTAEMAWRSAEIQSVVRTRLSLADRSCLAAAAILGMPVLTADRAWSDVGPAFGVEVRLIR